MNKHLANFRFFLFFILLIFILNPGSLNAAPLFGWANGVGGEFNETGTDWGDDITTDQSGNVYTIGSFQESLIFSSSFSFVSLGVIPTQDIFISKHNSSGSFVWAKQIGGVGDDTAFKIDTDSDGYIYASGCFEGTIVIGEETLNSSQDCFLVKLDQDGDIIWVKQGYRLLGVDGISVYIQSNDSFKKIDPQTGDALWSVATSNDSVFDIDFDQNHNIYTLHLQSKNIKKFDTLGNIIWTKPSVSDQYVSTPYCNIFSKSIDLDNDDNIYITGQFNGNCDFDPGSSIYNISSPANGLPVKYIFNLKLNSSGDFEWANAILTSGDYSSFFNSTVDSSGNSYIVGDCRNNSVFGSSLTLSCSSQSADIFISKQNSQGEYLWAVKLGGNSFDTATNVRIDTFQNIYITGSFGRILADFNPGPENFYLGETYDSTDLFILKLLSDFTPPVISSFTIPSNYSSLNVPIVSLVATDNSSIVDGYKISEISTPPLSGDSGWTLDIPENYIFSSAGNKTLYAWAKDQDDNVSSSSINASVLIEIPDDTTPDSFSFTTQNNIAKDTVIYSNTVTIAGINTATPISITSCTGTECGYSINSGSYSSDASSVSNGDTVTVKMKSSSSVSTTTSLTLNVGDVINTFTINTSPLPPPNSNSFGPSFLINGETIEEKMPTFNFSISGDDTKYQIQIDNNYNFSSPVVDYVSQSGSTSIRYFSVGQKLNEGIYNSGMEFQTLNNGSYYWRVRSIDGESVSDWTTANSGNIAFVVSNNSNWNIVGNFNNSYFKSIKIYKDNLGDLYVLYKTEDNAGLKKLNGSSWVNIGSVFSSEKISEMDLVFNTNNVPYVFYTLNSGGWAHVKKFNNSLWEDVGLYDYNNYISFGAAFDIKINIDIDDIPVVSFSDSGYSNRIFVKKFDPILNKWGSLGSMPETSVVKQISDISNDGMLYIAYSYLVDNNEQFVVMRKNGTWQNFSSFVFDNVNLIDFKLDNNNTPYVFYKNSSNCFLLKKYQNQSWVSVGESSDNCFHSSLYSGSIYFDTDNNPYILFQYLVGYNMKSIVSLKGYLNGSWNNIGTSFYSTGSNTSFNSSFYLNLNNPTIMYLFEDAGVFNNYIKVLGIEETEEADVLYYPSIITENASSLTKNSAQLNGNILDTGTGDVLIRGFEYGESGNFNFNVEESGNFQEGIFSLDLDSLQCETLYNYRGYLNNIAGKTISSDNKTFYTSTCTSSSGGSSGGGGGSSTTVDKCSNIAGTQSSIPSGYTLQNGLCVTTTPVINSCSNGMTIESNCTLPQTTTTPTISNTSTTQTTNNSYTFSKPLKFGQKNNDGIEVYNLQKFLNSKGYTISLVGPGSLGNETNFFGLKTKEALIKFQLANNLTPDGVFGPATRAKVNELNNVTVVIQNPSPLAPPITTTTNPNIYTFSKPLKMGSNNNDVNEVYNLKVFLNTHGYPLALTGLNSLGNENKYFGLSLHNALIKFQKDNNLTPDGVFGPKTRAKVNELNS